MHSRLRVAGRAVRNFGQNFLAPLLSAAKAASLRRLIFRTASILIFSTAVVGTSPAAFGEEKKAAPTSPPEWVPDQIDPRWTPIFPIPQVLERPAVIPREVPPPAEPRTVWLKNRRATVFPNIRMHPSSITTQSEMSIATHPLSPDVVLAGANAVHTAVTVGSQGWYHTTDGGVTWSGGDTLPTHTNLALFMADPAVGIDLDGNLFFNALLYGGTSDVIVARSTDNGVSWNQSAVPPDSGGFRDKNHMAIDINSGSPFENRLYTAYTDFGPFPGPVMFSRSTNRGVSFSVPTPISGGVGAEFAQGINLAVGPNGELYAAWSGYDVFPPVTTRLGFNKSTDGGVTWQGAVSIGNVFDIRGTLVKGGNSIRVNSFPSMAVDRSGGPQHGWIYIVYAEKNPTTPDIFLVRSTDGGATWSSPRQVNQDAGAKDQWFSWITVDPVTGHLYVVYYDSRNFSANDSAQVYISASADGGDTFEDILVSDMAFLPTPIPGLAGGYSGDYIGISALNGIAWPCWNDNRTGIHQAYTSRVVFLEVGSPPTISVSPDTLDFGEVHLGYPETLSVSVRNLGFPESLTVSNIVSDNSDFAPELTNFVLPGGGVQKVKVIFNPSGAGAASGVLTIVSSDTANPSVAVTLKGEGLIAPDLLVFPDSFRVDLFTGDRAVETLTVANTGGSDLRFNLSIGEQTALARSVRPLRLRPLQKIQRPPYKPLKNWPDYRETGKGNEGLASRSPAALLPPLPVVITDPAGDGGVADLTILRGAGGSGQLQIQMELSTTIVPSNFGGFLSLDIDQNRATGAPPSFGNPNQDIGAEYEFTFFSLTSGVVDLYNAVTGSFVGSYPVSIGTNTLDFSAPLADLGGDDGKMDVTGVIGDVSGPTDWFPDSGHGTIGALDFLSASPDSGTIPSGFSLAVEVTFDAAGIPGGHFFAGLLISSNDPDEPVDTTPVHLHVIGAPNILLSDDTLDFGNVFVGYSDTLALTVFNDGTDLLEVTGMSQGNPRFALLDAAVFNVPPGDSHTVRVQFLPAAVGLERDSLFIASSDSTDSIVPVLLLGNGLLPPDISVLPDSLLESLFTGETAVETLTVSNTGFSDLVFELAVEFGERPVVARILPTNNAPRSQKSSPLLPGSEEARSPVFNFKPSESGAWNVTGGSGVSSSVSHPSNHWNAAAGDTIRSIPAPPGNVLGLTWLDNTLWAVVATSPQRIVQLDPDNGNVLSFFTIGSGFHLGLANDGRNLWVCDFSAGLIKKYAPSGTLLTSWSAPNGGLVRGIAWDGSALWIGGASSGLLYRVDTLGVVLGTRTLSSPVIAWAMDMEWVAKHPGGPLWVIDDDVNVDINQLAVSTDPATLVQDFPHPAPAEAPEGVAHDGENLWVSAFYAPRIYVVDDGLEELAWLVPNPTSGVIPAGSSVGVEVTFNAAGLNGGDYFANILISSNDPDEPVDTTPVHLTVIGAPNIVLSDDTLDFGDVFINYSDTLALTVSNNGSDLLEVTGMSINNSRFSLLDAGVFNVPPGNSQDVRLAFSPLEVGPDSGILSIASTDSTDPVVYVQLRGNGIDFPIMQVAPDSFGFTLNEGDSASAFLTIHNNGLGVLQFGVSHEFLSAAAPLIRPPASSSFLKSERVLNPYSSLARIANPISTEGIAPAAAQSSRVSSSGGRLFGAGGSQIVEIDLNAGMAINSFPTPVPTSDGPTALAFSGTRLYFTDEFTTTTIFVLDPNGGAVVDSFPVPPSSSIDALAFVGGKLYAQDYIAGVILELNPDDGAVLRTITPPVPIVGGLDGGNGRLFASNFGSAIYELSLVDGSVINSFVPVKAVYGLGFGPSRLFASVPGGGIDAYDPGTGAFLGSISTLSFAALAGGGAAWLSESPDSGTVLPGDSALVELKVKTDGLDGGTFRANILVSSNDPANRQDTVPVRLRVIGTPNIVLSDDTLDFGGVFVGYPDTLTLTVFNDGSDLLEVSGMSNNNPRFALLDVGVFNVPPGDSQAVRVQFLPVAVGSQRDTLFIASTDSSDPVVYVVLRGEGIHFPVLEVSPDSFAFTLVKGDSGLATMVISNPGLGTLSFELTTRPFHPLLNSYPFSVVKPSAQSGTNRSETPPAGYEPVLSPEKRQKGAAPAADVLLIQDAPPWGTTANETVLQNNGISFDVINSASIVSTDFSLYGVIIVPSDQPQSYYNEIDARQTKFNNYVAAGGVLEFHAAGWGWNGGDPSAIVLPGGMRINPGFYGLNYVLLPSHPAVAGIPSPFTGTAASHAYFTSIPVGASLIVRDEAGGMNLVEYNFGTGKVIASGQTLEYGYANGQHAGIILQNLVPYSFSIASPSWLTLTPTSGLVGPGGTAEIQVKAKTDEVDTGQTVWAHILISGTDPSNPQDTVPARLTVKSCAVAKGDLNGDSLFTIADAVLEMNCVFLGEGGGTAGGNCNFCYSDANCDGKLSAADIILVLHAVFLFRPFPC